MPAKKPVEDVEEESSVVDETEETEGSDKDKETVVDAGVATEDKEPSEETTEEIAAEPDAEAPPSASQLADSLTRIKALEDENARLKGERATEEPRESTPSHPNIQAFVSRYAPEAKKRFSEVSPVTVKEDGTVSVDKEAVAKQFDAIHTMTDQMLGAVLADHISPVLENLARRNITLANELEIRDLRASGGSVFKSLEASVRKELKALAWNDRLTEDTVTRIYHRLLGSGNGRVPTAPSASAGRSASATAALKDVSGGGGGGTSAKKIVGVKLSPEQEVDFSDMVEQGMDISRERYYARYKARAEKAKAEKRPVPKTLRSYR